VTGRRGPDRHERPPGDGRPCLHPALVWSSSGRRDSNCAGDPSIQLLGGFGVVARGAIVPLRAPARRVVAYLAVNGDGPHERGSVSEALWPDRPDDAARTSLRQAVCSEHRLGAGLIDAGARHLRLAPGVTVDLHRALAAADEILSQPADAGPTVDPSLFLHELLPSWDEEWLILERERFARLRLACLEELGRRWLERREWHLAEAAAAAVAATDPLRESPRMLLARAYIGQGNRVDAIREYSRYRDHVRDVLGGEPSPEYRRLIDELR